MKSATTITTDNKDRPSWSLFSWQVTASPYLIHAPVPPNPGNPQDRFTPLSTALISLLEMPRYYRQGCTSHRKTRARWTSGLSPNVVLLLDAACADEDPNFGSVTHCAQTAPCSREPCAMDKRVPKCPTWSVHEYACTYITVSHTPPLRKA